MGMSKTERNELLDELRDIALKFYRGNNAENRDGFRQVGMVERLEAIIYKIKFEKKQGEK